MAINQGSFSAPKYSYSYSALILNDSSSPFLLAMHSFSPAVSLLQWAVMSMWSQLATSSNARTACNTIDFELIFL